MKQLFTALAFMMLLGGCSLADLAMFSSDHDCTSTYDCTANAVCHFGSCIPPGGDAGEIIFVLEAPPYGGFPAQQDPGGARQADAGIYHKLTLTPGMRAQGKVTVASGDSRTGTLSISNSLDIPGVSRTQTVHSGQDGFTVELLPGNYLFSFEPDDSQNRPPVAWAPVEITAETVDELQFSYPEDITLQEATGTVVFTDSPRRPVIGAVVQGEHESDSGNTIYSSPSLTDADGRYHLAFPGSVDSYSLRVSPGVNYFIPEKRIPGLSPDEDAVANLSLVPTAQSFAVRTALENGELVGGTTLYFQGIVQEYGADLASFQFALQTGPTGGASVNLLPGLYTVTAVPPRSSNASVAVQEICIAGASLDQSLCYVSDILAGETLELTLGQKATFRGLLRSHLGSPVSDARVALHTTINGQRLEAVTNTNDTGSFELRVDQCPEIESTYIMDVIPPDRFALPRDSQEFTTTTFDTEQTITLPTPALLVGAVTTEWGEAVENVAISVYSVTSDTDAPLRLIGVGTSTTSGEFLIPLPAQGNQ